MDQRNVILAIAISLAILVGSQMALQYLYPPAPVDTVATGVSDPTTTTPAPGDASIPMPAPGGATTQGGIAPQPGTGIIPGVAPTANAPVSDAPRVDIVTDRISGSLSLKGARIDDVRLNDYRLTVDPTSPIVTVLRPSTGFSGYFAEFGWVAPDGATPVPGGETIWTADADALTVNRPLTLTWDNGQGLIFEKRISIDDNYMFTVDQGVRSTLGEPVTLFPYGLVSRLGTPETSGFFILHEGPLGVIGEVLEEHDYDDLEDDGVIAGETTGGWIGITDKYWLTALVPNQQGHVKTRFSHRLDGSINRYQTDYLGDGIVVPAGGVASNQTRLFSGAKEVKLLDAYEENLGIPRFDRAVDFGWFYFLTKPIFHAIHWLFGVLGNFGLAILALTVAIKLAFLPLANKSYRAMSHMKRLTPEMMKLRERFSDDKQKLNSEMMALYKREKVNPASGCIPILIQIPVFFSLYKVLFVTIEMRHAPFYGWIEDLSAPDPTNVFELFGLVPWNTPDFLHLGLWPLIMGATMFLQQRLNPQPADPIQAKVFMLMPIMFTVLLAGFPAGLVIYWAWNNLLSIAQQWLIMKSVDRQAARKAKGGGKGSGKGGAVTATATGPEIEGTAEEVESGEPDDDGSPTPSKPPKPGSNTPPRRRKTTRRQRRKS